MSIKKYASLFQLKSPIVGKSGILWNKTIINLIITKTAFTQVVLLNGAASKKVSRLRLVTPPPLCPMRAMMSVPDSRIASQSLVSPILLNDIIKTPKPL